MACSAAHKTKGIYWSWLVVAARRRRSALVDSKVPIKQTYSVSVEDLVAQLSVGALYALVQGKS